MSNKWMKFIVAAAVVALMVPTSALAVCVVTVTGPIAFHVKGTGAVGVTDPTPLTPGAAVDGVLPNNVAGTTPATLNSEGTTERVSDVIVSDSGAGAFCFGTGNHVVITLNAVLKSPASLTVPGNIDIYDSNGTGGLTIAGATITPGFAANTAQTVIDITVQQTGTTGDLLTGTGAGGTTPSTAATGAALRIKNLRIDATGVAGATATATVSATGQTVAGNPFTVGTKVATVTPNPMTPTTVGAGTQSSGEALTTQASFTFTEGFGAAFRTAGTSAAPYSGIANDLATNATSLTFSVTGIPSGVTVTFPSTINTSAAAGAATGAIVWTARSATLTNGGAPGTLTVIYDTTTNGTAAGTVTIDTAATAQSNGAAGCAGAACNAKVGVAIAGVSGAGTVSINASFGPGETSSFAGDDLNASAIPRYGLGKNFTGGAKSWFVITPTRSTLLYSFVSNLGGFNTGIAVANTSQDCLLVGAACVAATDKVFGAAAANSTGGIKFYFFNSNGDAFTLNTDVTAGGVVPAGSRGLNASVQLPPGASFAASLNSLLSAAGKPPSYLFDGYVIAVTSFTNGHGVASVITPAGAPFASYSAAVMGNTARAGHTSANGEEGFLH